MWKTQFFNFLINTIFIIISLSVIAKEQKISVVSVIYFSTGNKREVDIPKVYYLDRYAHQNYWSLQVRDPDFF